MECFDWIVLGGGAAGLSLVDKLIVSPLRGKILLIEKAPKSGNDRTWCYWDKSDLPGVVKSSFTWENLKIRTKKVENKFSMGPYSYRMIQSGAFYHTMYDKLLRSKDVTVRYETVIDVSAENESATVRTDKTSYQGKWVFNSLMPLTPISGKIYRGLKQHFLGWWIETDRDVFHTDAVTLMDFDVPQEGGVQFVYVLPVSARRALVEYTVFSTTPWQESRYKDSIESYLKKRWEVNSYQVIEKESGVIPMSTKVFPRISDKRIIHIGTAGGVTKASTGYTFHRIQEDSEQMVNNLIKYDDPLPSPFGTSRFAFYDRLLIWLIQNQPEDIPNIMMRLFARNPLQRTLTFLNEKTTLIQELSIFLTLPWPPFLKALWYEYFQPGPAKFLGRLAQPDHTDRPASQPAD